MGFFDIFSDRPFDFNDDGYTDACEMALGFMVLDSSGKETEREKAKREFLKKLRLSAAAEGLEYSDKEIQQILADSESLGLFG